MCPSLPHICLFGHFSYQTEKNINTSGPQVLTTRGRAVLRDACSLLVVLALRLRGCQDAAFQKNVLPHCTAAMNVDGFPTISVALVLLRLASLKQPERGERRKHLSLPSWAQFSPGLPLCRGWRRKPHQAPAQTSVTGVPKGLREPIF